MLLITHSCTHALISLLLFIQLHVNLLLSPLELLGLVNATLVENAVDGVPEELGHDLHAATKRDCIAVSHRCRHFSECGLC